MNFNVNDVINLKVRSLEHFRGELPNYQSVGASGMDVRAQLTNDIELASLERFLIPTGLEIEIPRGFEIQVRPRSGWAIREGLSLINTPGTVDSDYRGELKVPVVNLGRELIRIRDQDRIAQLVLVPVARVHWLRVTALSATERSQGGFGSTGL